VQPPPLNFTFCGPCIMMYLCNKDQQGALFFLVYLNNHPLHVSNRFHYSSSGSSFTVYAAHGIYHASTLTSLGPGYLSRYSNLLRSGWPGDRIPVGARFSAHVQTGPGAHSAFCTMGTESFPGGKSGRGVTLTTHSPI